MSKQNTIPFREIREDEKKYAELAYKDNKKTAVIYYVISACFFVATIILCVVGVINDILPIMLFSAGVTLIVSVSLFLIGKNNSHYPNEIFIAQVINKDQSSTDEHKWYFVVCMVPSSDGTTQFEKHFELSKTEYDKAQIGSWVCVIKQTRLTNYVCVISDM